MAIYRGIGGTGDSATGEDVFGPNSSITSLDGITGGIEDPTYVRFAADNGGHIPLQGDLSWNTTEGTLDLGLNGGDVILQIGQEVHYRVTNQSGVSIPNGSLVAFAGTTGNSGKLLVELYDGTQPSKYVVGLATETIANGSNGYVTHFGKVRGIQTNGVNYGETWVDGDELYPDAGGLTNILPEAPNPKQPVAVVVNSHGSNGELFVRVQGHTSLEDDEKVQLTSLTNNDILQYDAVQARFENRSLSAAGVQPTLVSGTNIKTVNSTSLVGSGDVQVQAYDANLTSFVSTFTLPTVDGTTGQVLTTDGAGLLSFASGGGGVSDGDKGDITVSGGGTVWTIDNTIISTGKIADDAVTYAKIQNVSATDKLLGRSTAGAGDIEEITCTAAGRALLDDATASDQRTTLGLGTLATQGDGDKGDITVSASGATWTIDNDAVTYAKLQNISASSRILGRKTAAAGDTEECTLSEILDFVGSAAQGDILYRGVSSWTRLGAGTSGQYLKTNGAAANPAWETVTAGFTLGTPVATTSGTAIDFGSLPSGIKQLTVTCTGVSFTTAVALGFRLGTGGTPATTGYTSSYGTISTTANTTSGGTATAGFLTSVLGNAAQTFTGEITFTLQDSSTNTWTGKGVFTSTSDNAIVVVSGSVSLSGTLNIVRLYGGTFDAGKANIAYI